jgi:hypothetical protein
MRILSKLPLILTVLCFHHSAFADAYCQINKIWQIGNTSDLEEGKPFTVTGYIDNELTIQIDDHYKATFKNYPDTAELLIQISYDDVVSYIFASENEPQALDLTREKQGNYKYQGYQVVCSPDFKDQATQPKQAAGQ